jgi:hypothetical protein
MADDAATDGHQHVEYPEAEYDSGVLYLDTNTVPRSPAGTTLHMDLKEVRCLRKPRFLGRVAPSAPPDPF